MATLAVSSPHQDSVHSAGQLRLLPRAGLRALTAISSDRALLASRVRAAVDTSRALVGAVHERRRRYVGTIARLARRDPRWVRFVPATGAAPGAPLSIETETRPEAHVIRVGGEIDLGNVAVLRAAMEPAVQNSQSVIMDLSRVTYLDSTTLHLLVMSDHELRSHHCRLVVVGPPFLFKLILITGLQQHVNAVPSMEDAAKLLAGGGPS